jgi:hypothetical protein
MVASIAFRGLRAGPAVVTLESLSFVSGSGTGQASVPGPARITVAP